MVAIFPNDRTTSFLNSIVSHLNIEIIDPNWVTIDDLVVNIQERDHSGTVLYLGHGTANEINTNSGVELIIDSYYGKKMFYAKKIVLISCFSAQFIEKLSSYSVAIGFGNIPTCIDELSTGKKERYLDRSAEGVELFKRYFIEIIKRSIDDGRNSNSSFLVVYRLIKLRINKVISECSFSKEPPYKLAGELLFELKRGMVVKGNVLSALN